MAVEGTYKLLVTLLFGVLISGCTQVQYAEITNLRIGVQDNVITAIILVAEDEGYFDEQGLNVSLIKYPSGKLAAIGMFNSEVELSTASDIIIMNNGFKRSDFLVLSQIAKTDVGAWIIARKDKGINSPEDLTGKIIATQKSSAVHFYLSMFLLHNGISESDVNIVFMPAENLAQALINGSIDAFSMRNPFINQAKEELGEENIIEFFEPTAYTQTFNLIGMKDYINNNPEVIEKLVRSIVKAEELIKNDREEAINATIKQLGYDREQEIILDWDKYVFKVSLDQSLIITLEDEARWAIQNNFTTVTEVPNYLDCLYLNALKEVRSESIGVIH